MSFMTESLLLEAQSLRLEGDLDAAIDTLRTVLSQRNSDIRKSEDQYVPKIVWQMRQMGSYQLALLLLQRSGRFLYSNHGEDDATIDRAEAENKHSKDKVEADELLWKLGYRMRLSRKAFGYPSCCCVHKNTSSDLPLKLIDDTIPPQLFDALQFAFRSGSKYWSEFYSKINTGNVSSLLKDAETKRPSRNQFVSHNIQLPTTPDSSGKSHSIPHSLQHANSLFEQIAIIIQHKLIHRFPILSRAKSVEVWCHQRPPDGSHQLHYDMDEIRLGERKKSHPIDESSDITNSLQPESKRPKIYKGLIQVNEESNREGAFCPMVSCVLTISVPNSPEACIICNETSKGSPTLVCNQSILNQSKKRPNSTSNRDGIGWLCYPKPNRLLAFDGSLLHGVVPGIPEPDCCPHSSNDDNINTSNDIDHDVIIKDIQSKRVTLMLGFWDDTVCTQSTSKIGPNMPFPRMPSDNPSDDWTGDFLPIKLRDNEFVSASDSNSNAFVEVKPLWTPIYQHHNNTFSEYTKELGGSAINFSGRFFLKSNDTNVIDNEILHPTGT